MKRIVCLAFTLIMAVTCVNLVGCSNKYPPNTLVIYTEYNGVLGEHDKAVKQRIEEKFKQDTGDDLNLVVEPLSTGDAGNKMGQAMTSGSSLQVDAFVYHYGYDSVLNGYIIDESCQDLSDYVDDAPNFFKYYNNDTYDKDGLSYYSGVYKDKLYSLSTQEFTSGWGAIVRKDHMKNTSFNPDEYDVANENSKSLSISDFYKLLSELKENNETVNRPLVGMSWEVDEILGGAFESVGYGQKILDKDNNVVPSYADDNYLKLMEFENRLQNDKLWIENPSATTVDLKQYFASGKGSVYVEWPEVTSQASVAMSLKDELGVDCIMLAPIKGDDAELSNGNLRRAYAFKGLIVPYKSKNAELVMKYINWLYASKENYELAYFGILGEHWVKGDDLSFDGKTIETWDYPENSNAKVKKPYSGIYCLVENINMSQRIYNGYTTQQKNWINNIRTMPSYPKKYVTEGMILPGIPSSERALIRQDTAHGKEYVGVRKYAWSDAPLPEGETMSSLYFAMKNNLYDSYFDLITYHTTNYNNIVSKRAD